MQDRLTKKSQDLDNKPYLIALNHISGIGPMTVVKALQRWPSLKDMFDLPSTELMNAGFSSSLACAIKQFSWHEVEKDLTWQEQAEHHILTWCDEEYPKLLLEIPDPPPVLYAVGDRRAFLQPSVAMVGTRKPSVTGSETAFQFAKVLSEHAVTIVSGLALGIDGAAHAGCLKGHGKTIAVLGTGVERIYPRQHQALAERICENGLLLSEFSRRTSAIAGHFPRRNRIISGLSSITLVIEAAIKSGSLITARLAMEQNRDVLAVPGSIYNVQSKGCHYLLQQGAKLVSSVRDILDELDLSHFPAEVDKTKVMLASKNQNLVKCIGFEITTVDQILKRSGLSIEEVMCCLADLELLGIIKAVSSGYMRCM